MLYIYAWEKEILQKILTIENQRRITLDEFEEISIDEIKMFTLSAGNTFFLYRLIPT